MLDISVHGINYSESVVLGRFWRGNRASHPSSGTDVRNLFNSASGEAKYNPEFRCEVCEFQDQLSFEGCGSLVGEEIGGQACGFRTLFRGDFVILSTPMQTAVASPVVEFRGVSFRIGQTQVLCDLNLQVNAGELLVLLGRSGSGKTTTLKLVNRLASPTAGEVWVNGQPNSEIDLIRLRRSIGYVIQEVGLFPHFSVARNIGLVPRIEGWPEARVRDRINELMQLTGLTPDIASRYPHQLSGGQRQRVGVARALAADPDILLMDEPFGALDPLTRDELQREFLSLQQRLSKTVLFVTHDLHEAMRLGSRIALMEAGKLVTVLTPVEFLRSSDPWAAAYVKAFRDRLDTSGKEGAP